MKRLFWDIETSPNIVLSWRVGKKIDLTYDNILAERKIICIGYKWAGERVNVISWDKNQDDKSMLQEFIPILDEADESVGHYINGFDLPWVKTRCMFHGIPTMPKYTTIDTCAWARKFNFNSAKLDYLAKYMGLGEKLETEFGLWKKVLLEGDEKSLRKMMKYCGMDVILLEKVFNKLQAAMPHKTHVGVLQEGAKWTCPKCGSTRVISRGRKVSASGSVKRSLQCNDCGGYYTVSETTFRAFQA